LNQLLRLKNVKNDKNYTGYHGKALKTLKEFNVRVWSIVKIKTRHLEISGLILPRSSHLDDTHITLKLDTGYNTGINIEDITLIEEKGYEPGRYHLPKPEVKPDKSKPRIALLGSGGTIASRLDYKSGAVIPALTPEELYSAVPELAEIAFVDTRLLFELFSENIQPTHWVQIAKEVVAEVNEREAAGVIIAHGTDTLSFTSAALAFMLKELSVPVVLVGSQRSSDRPSSDAAFNLMSAAIVATRSDLAESVVCMHGGSGDNYSLIHRGTRVRKMHSSRRDAFRSIGCPPMGMVRRNELKLFTDKYKRRNNDKIVLDARIEPKVALINTYPGMQPDFIDSCIDNGYRGVVIAGTGLGHTPSTLHNSIERAKDEEIIICMTTQCLWGFVGMRVYENGRELLNRGVIPLSNMLPETAYVKLICVLGRTQNRNEIKTLMQKNLCGEILKREPFNGYPVLQGGLTDVDNFLKKIEKPEVI